MLATRLRPGLATAFAPLLLVSAVGSSMALGATEAPDDTQSDDPPKVYPDMPEGPAPVFVNPEAVATDEASMNPYRERVPGSEVEFQMLAIPSGTFTMGSPEEEEDRKGHEGPTHPVAIAPFWMGQCEVTWNEYHVFMSRLDQQARRLGGAPTTSQDPWADSVSRPTPPYVPMDFEMGVDGYPAICMTQFAAKQYTRWLSMKTGRFYRLPTEAEWEYACRAGTRTAYFFGDDPDMLDEYAWYFDNADDQYQPVGLKKPNPFGLHDIHGNVAEWVLDGFSDSFYGDSIQADGAPARNPLHWPTELYPRVVRGGSWDDDPDALRSAARRGSSKSWKVQDPQLPKSIWYHTDATFVGFRIVRPLTPPPFGEWERYWSADLDSVREIQEKQRRGGR